MKILTTIILLFISVAVFSQYEGTVKDLDAISRVDSADYADISGYSYSTNGDSITNLATVGKSGCNYTRIQDALDASGDYAVISVAPGTYTADSIFFTADYQTVVGRGSDFNVFLLGSDTTLVNVADYSGCQVKNITIVATSTEAVNMIEINDGNLLFENAIISQANGVAVAAALQASICHIDGSGEAYFKDCSINYDNEGAEATAIKTAFIIDDDGYISIDGGSVDVDVENATSATAMCSFGGNGELKIANCNIDIDDEIATYVSGTGYVVTGIIHQEVYNCDISVSRSGAGAADVAAFYASGGSAASVVSHKNVICVTNTATPAQAYAYYQAGTPTINAYYDRIDCGEISGVVSYVFSEPYGDFVVSGTTTVDSLQVDNNANIDGVITNSGAQYLEDPDTVYSHRNDSLFKTATIDASNQTGSIGNTVTCVDTTHTEVIYSCDGTLDISASTIELSDGSPDINASTSITFQANDDDELFINDDGVRIEELFAFTPSSTVTLSTDDSLTVTNSVMYVAGNGGAVTGIGINDGTFNEQFIIIKGTSDVNTVRFDDGKNIELDGGNNIILGNGDRLSLSWDSIDNVWYMNFASDN